MMYCPHCGALIAHADRFCTGCGKTLPEAPAPEALKARELALLEQLYAHFSRKTRQYELYDKTCLQIPHYGPGASYAAFIWAALVAGVASLMILGCCIAGEFGSAAAVFGLSNIPCFFLVGGGLLVHRRNRINYRTCCQRYLELGAELMAHYRACPNCPLPPEYTNPRALEAIRKRLEAGTSTTVAGSIHEIISDFNLRAAASERAQMECYTGHLPQPQPVFLPGRFFSQRPGNKKDAFRYYIS